MRYKLLEGFPSMLPKEAFVPAQPSDIQMGDYVKIGVETASHKTEKFWAYVYFINSATSQYHVRINNDLILTSEHGLRDGSTLRVDFIHVVAAIR